MDEVSDLRVIGIDEKRLPRVRKEPYIDLVFKLNHQAPSGWCEDFNKMTKRLNPPMHISPEEGLFIVTYVREMDKIEATLDTVKKTVTSCKEKYIEAQRQREAEELLKAAAHLGEGAEQQRLNAIIAGLKYD